MRDQQPSFLGLLYSNDLDPMFNIPETYENDNNLPLLSALPSSPPSPAGARPPSMAIENGGTMGDMQGEQRKRRGRAEVDESNILPKDSRRARGKSARLLAS